VKRCVLYPAVCNQRRIERIQPMNRLRQYALSTLRPGILIFLWMGTIFAQDGSFTASVEQTKVGTAEQFQVTFTVSGASAVGAQNFRPPDFSPFVVLSGPISSTVQQWINGKSSSTVSYTYVLYARQTGKYSVGSATIDYQGKQLKTQPLQIEVVQGKPQQKQQSAEQGAVSIGDNLFIRAFADKGRAKQGEQITITYKLYTKLAIANYELTKAPTYEGFWSEDLEQSRQPAVVNETYEGKQYRVAVIKKTALFATQAGNLKIAPLEVRCAVQVQAKRRSNDPFNIFDDPIFQQTQTQQLDFKSNPLAISIDPLPANPPSGYAGAVGEYTFAAGIDKKTVQAGDPITLKIAVAGTGNVKLISLPKPVLPADLEAYDPKITEDISRDGGIIRGKKVAEYLLVPRNPGKRSIESIPFSYYDLQKHSFVRLSSLKFDITITPGKEIASVEATMVSKEDVKLLGEDIRFLKLTPGELHTITESPVSSDTMIFVGILPPVVFIGAFVYRKRMKAIYGDMPKFRFQQAGKEASRRLKQAKHLLAQGNTESYHAEISRALLGYLEDKLHMEKSSLTVEEAVNRLQQQGVGEETVRQLQSCIERAEFARFALASDTTVGRKELLDAASKAISATEKTFTGRS
jgi:hypothetical protein